MNRKELNESVDEYTKSVRDKQTADIVKFVRQMYGDLTYLSEVRDEIATTIEQQFK